MGIKGHPGISRNQSLIFRQNVLLTISYITRRSVMWVSGWWWWWWWGRCAARVETPKFGWHDIVNSPLVTYCSSHDAICKLALSEDPRIAKRDSHFVSVPTHLAQYSVDCSIDRTLFVFCPLQVHSVQLHINAYNTISAAYSACSHICLNEIFFLVFCCCNIVVSPAEPGNQPSSCSSLP